MKKNDAFPSKYVSKEDVDTPVVFIIAKVAHEDVQDGDTTKTKTVISFQNGKPMICNGVNWDTIESAYGPESDEWVGKMIELFHDPTVMFGRDRVGGVRVRIPRQGPTLQELRANLKQARAELKATGIEPAPMTQAQVAALDAEQLADLIAQVEAELPI